VFLALERLDLLRLAPPPALPQGQLPLPLQQTQAQAQATAKARASALPFAPPFSLSQPSQPPSLPPPMPMPMPMPLPMPLSSPSGPGGGGGGGGGSARPSLDALTDGLFRCLRFDVGLAPDSRLVAAVCYLFTAAMQQQQQQQGWPGAGAGSGSGAGSGAGAGFGLDGDSSSGGGGSFGSRGGAWGWGRSELSQATARLVLEELIVAGFEPDALLPVVRACRFSVKKERALLADEDGAVRRIRASAASRRIFKKYRWNDISSGFSSLGF